MNIIIFGISVNIIALTIAILGPLAMWLLSEYRDKINAWAWKHGWPKPKNMK